MSRRIVKTSKVMARELNKTCPYTVIHQSMSERQFIWYFGIYADEHDNDYDYRTGEYNVIKVIYPEEYYSVPKILTTNDLLDMLKRCSNKTWDGFVEEFNNEVAI